MRLNKIKLNKLILINKIESETKWIYFKKIFEKNRKWINSNFNIQI